MNDFGRLVEEAKRELAAHSTADQAEAAPPGTARWRIENSLRERELLRARLSMELQQLEAHLETFSLRPDTSRSPFRRTVAGWFNRLLSFGGLALLLGSTQRRANEAALTALRLVQLHLEEQDRVLVALHDLLRAEPSRQSSREHAPS
jgi:hypothetical protein